MKLLVTGGAGYIGSVVAARLLEEGHEVVVLDDLSTGHRDAVPPDAEFIEGRIQDAFRVLDGGDFEAVVHLAAYSLVSESIRVPERYRSNNTAGTALLCDAMHHAGVSRLVVSSTAAVYGEPATPLIDEQCDEDPVNPYGASKLAVDRDLSLRAAEQALAAMSLRYFNVAGAYGPYGERHEPETHLVPIALDAAMGRRESVTVYGTDYPTRDGTCVRDYVHVVDIADAHLLALGCLTPGRHDVINLGNGAGYTVREVLDTVETVTGQDLQIVVGERRSGDPAILVASSQRAHERLGWSPTHPDLTTIVADAWHFVSGSRP